jgi:RAP1 GTPase activating protein 1
VKAIKAAVPDLAKINLIKVKGPELSEEMLKMEAKEVVLGARYKFGVLYAKAGQTEDEIFANEKPSADFEEFCDFLGDKIPLLGWTKYTGGLDVKSGSTGEFSVFKEVDGIAVMFHVCTMLPAQIHDLQRVERKRHIGNDVVTFVFKEGDDPFVPTILTSQFIRASFRHCSQPVCCPPLTIALFA